MSRKARKEKCNKYKNKKNGDNNLTVIDGGFQTRRRQNEVNIIPRNFHQDDLLGHLQDDNVNIIFAVGPAGTGKTLISTLAGIQLLKQNKIDKFIVTRPAIGADGEDHGFLPGTLVEKLAPWVRPVMDQFEEYYSPDQIEYMMGDNKIEVSPLAYMRGRSFSNAYIIGDEMQNTTPSQMKMLLTRIGEGSKLVITGDLDQADRSMADNGLADFLNRIESTNSNRIKVVRFNNSDIERHPVVEEVLNIYK